LVYPLLYNTSILFLWTTPQTFFALVFVRAHNNHFKRGNIIQIPDIKACDPNYRTRINRRPKGRSFIPSNSKTMEIFVEGQAVKIASEIRF